MSVEMFISGNVRGICIDFMYADVTYVSTWYVERVEYDSSRRAVCSGQQRP